MPKADDPYYNRKPVPAEFVQDVAETGLTPQEEFYNRERKYSDHKGVDVRRFFGGKGSLKPQNDPYYGRKRVSNAETHDVAPTGLTEEEEHFSRERKYSVNGVDVRKFSTSATGGLEPLNDPYYGRKQVSSTLTKGIGETGYTPAEEFEVRERKQSVVNFSGDPFQQLIGTGHRQSISQGASVGAAATRRRSSAAPMDNTRNGSGQRYQPDEKLAPIDSRPELPSNDQISSVGEGSSSRSSGPSTNGERMTSAHMATTTGSAAHTHETSASHNGTPAPPVRPVQQEFEDPDSVAPDQMR